MSIALVIPVFQLSGDRLRNFEFILARAVASACFDEVIVAEQVSQVALPPVPDGVRVVRVEAGNTFRKATAVNAAVRATSAEWLFVSDADVFLPYKSIAAACSGGVGVDELVVPFRDVVSLDPSLTHKFLGRHQVTVQRPSSLPRTCSLGAKAFIVNRTRFLEVGGLNPAYEPWSVETEFGCRVRRALSVRYLNDVRGVHLYHPYGENRQAADTPAVIVTAHRPYVRKGWLRAAVDSIDAQSALPIERVVVLDGCDAPKWLRERPGWTVMRGDWQSPNPARNLGMEQTSAPWIVWWDADNVMPAEYIAGMVRSIARAEPRTAILYADMQFCNADMVPTRFVRMPGTCDHWALRVQNCIDTGSAWRRAAVEQAGGWSAVASADDYALALRLTALGWGATHTAAPPILYREHGRGRWRLNHNAYDNQALWDTCSLTILVLFAGRQHLLDAKLHWLATCEIPGDTRLILADNSGSPAFADWLRQAVSRHGLWDRYRSVSLVPAGTPYDPTPGEPYVVLARHQHVADLMARLTAQVTSDYLLTSEDDVLELPVEAIRELWAPIRPGNRVGAVAAAYASPQNADLVCAARHKDEWRGMPTWDSLRDEPEPVGFVGGGCTLWSMAGLRQCAPFHATMLGGRLRGWDTNACRELRSRNFQILLAGAVRAQHYTHGMLPGSVYGRPVGHAA